jgi:hypothetical protein
MISCQSQVQQMQPSQVQFTGENDWMNAPKFKGAKPQASLNSELNLG